MRNILITGASSGIGFDTAIYLYNRGYKVYATARDIEDVKKLRDLGLKSYQLDVRDFKQVKEVLEKIIAEDKKLYALFNNAGYGQSGAVEDLSVDILKQQFETNFFALFNLTNEVLKIMRKQGYGRILQHSSVLGLISLRFRGAYNASKYAIEGLNDTLRLELSNTNIFVSTINTGPIKSKFRDNAIKIFFETINYKDSIFRSEYEKEVLGRKESKDDDIWTKNSDVVFKNIVHALEAKRAKPRYYNTEATYILAFLKRVLPTNLLDKILRKIV